MISSLRILSWNSNGLINHKEELQVILDTQKIDVCLISETHFTKQSYVKFEGYIAYQAIHPSNTPRGGSAVLIREKILHYEEEKFENEEMQVAIVSIKLKNYYFKVASIYCPPRFALKKHHFIQLFEVLGNRFIIGGDFNAKNTAWGSRLTTTKGRELLSAINDYRSDFISTGKPTYWPSDPNKIPDLIDFFIIKNISFNYIKIEENYDLNSDHSPILLTLSEKNYSKRKYCKSY